jgi:hypothetical protein
MTDFQDIHFVVSAHAPVDVSGTSDRLEGLANL